MPAVDEHDRTHGGGLVTALFWVGVALAPLAAALLMLADGSTLLRAAVVVVVVAVVLIGLSITLRRDGDSLRVEVEDVVLGELDGFRQDVRGDISHAARSTHKALVDKIVVLNNTVESLRGQVDLLRGQLGQAPAGFEAGAPPGVAQGVSRPVAGGVLRTETVHVTTRHTTVMDPHESLAGRGTVYGNTGGGDRSGRRDEPYDARTDGEHAGRIKIPVPRSGGGGDWSVPALAQEPEPDTGSWTEQLLRRRFAESHATEGHAADSRAADSRGPDDRREARVIDGRFGSGRSAEERFGEGHADQRYSSGTGLSGSGGRRSREYDPPRDPRHDREDEDPVSGVRATDRWAAMRSDDRGRELRVGERRATVQADESGSEVRIEDRWAAVLRDEESRHAESRQERDSDDGGYWSERTWETSRGDQPGRWTQTRREFGGGQRGRQAALPAGPDDAGEASSSWMRGWDARKEPMATDRPASSEHGRASGYERGGESERTGGYGGGGRSRYSRSSDDGYGRSGDDGYGRSGDGGYGHSGDGGYGHSGDGGYGHSSDGRSGDGGHGRSGRREPEYRRAGYEETGAYRDPGYDPGDHRSGERGPGGYGAGDYSAADYRAADYATPDYEDSGGWRSERDDDRPRSRGSRSRLVDFEVTDDRWR